MKPILILTENWLTREPHRRASAVMIALAVFVILASFIYWQGLWGADQWMSASAAAVFERHEFWRAWTAVFAHADAGHLFSNLLLLVPLAYLLSAYFSFFLFPFLAFIESGLINLLVLHGMPASVSLLGISGVVHWMGAVWLTLSLLVDRREKLRRRFAFALFLTMILFVPESYRPEISYASHFVGFVLGGITGSLYYLWNRSRFLDAEVYEVEQEDVEVPEAKDPMISPDIRPCV